MRMIVVIACALGMAACHPKPTEARRDAEAAPSRPDRPLIEDRAAAFAAMAEIIPALDRTPSAFRNDALGQCGVAASADLSVRLCGPGSGIAHMLITGRKPGLDIAPSVAALVKVTTPDASPEALARVTGEARQAVADGEVATVCLTARCFQVAGLDRTWIISAAL